MTPAELETVVSGGESAQVEFKATTGQRTDGAKTICAMLNGAGGFVFFGVADDGAIRGMTVTTATVDDVTREIRKIEPHPALTPDRVSLASGRDVIVVSVPGHVGGPFTYDGRPYVREGSSTVVMPQEHYRRLLIEGAQPAHRWELLPAHGFGIDDLDAGEITLTIDEAVRRLRLEDPGTRDTEALLQGLKLIRNGQLLNAAVALFGKTDRLLPNYPQCLLRMARFRGTDKIEFIDNRQEVGNAFELLQRAQRFLRDHLPIGSRMLPNVFERKDDPLYPPAALREALANALCHRDYAMPGGSVGIAIYDDRLEITSVGHLPFGLTPSDLRRPHTSQPWNPLIASVFYRRGVIEHWGRGTLRILELAEEAGLLEPEFEQRGSEVVVRFFAMGYVPPSRVTREISPLQQELLEILSSLGRARLSEIEERLESNVPRYVLQENLQALRTLRLVQLEGRTRGARWRLAGS